MKKFTFMLLTAFIAVAAMAAGPQKRTLTEIPAMAQFQLGQKVNAKQAPVDMVAKTLVSKKARAPKKAVAAADLVGDYTWNYLTSSEHSTDLESLSTSEGSAHVTIALSETTEGGITISGMFTNPLEATVESDENGDYLLIKGAQTAGTSSYGDYVVYGMYYFEGDDENQAGWYYSDIYGYISEEGIAIYPWLCRVLSTGNYAGYALTPYFVEGSTLTETEPLTLVELPEGVEVKAYVMTYDEGNSPVNVAVDGNDVYFQGMSYYIPDAWVKGTKDGNQVTFPAMQYMGEYGTYGSSYFFYNGETVFTYDAEADTYSAEGQVFGVLADRYYDGNYTNPVLNPVVEVAAMPANPAITALENSTYGWYIDFNVPLVDTEGNPMVSSKLSYMFYTDVEGEVLPLTFTPETHSRLTESITEIPFGFTENYDFYDTTIYLNDLFSEDWNRIGIQSIYTGGDERNVTEIQWFDIKPYSIRDATFNFNAMEVATSNSVSTDGDITEALTLKEDIVSFTISPKAEGKTTENRFWSTSDGPQLRLYSGTLTFTVPEGSVITQIVFNHNGKWGANSVGGEAIPNDATAKAATWTGEAEKVVVTIAANSQINSIVVSIKEGDVPPVVAPEDLVTESYMFSAMARTAVYDEETESYYLGEAEAYKAPVEVGFYGEDKLYISGLSQDFPEFFVKATKNEAGQYVIPANQFMGTYEYWGYSFDYYFTAIDEAGNFQDAVLSFDPETNTITSDQTLALNGSADVFDPYMAFDNVVIAKIAEIAATPADPQVLEVKLTGTNYPSVRFDIPLADVEGNDLIPSKLFYTIWVEKDEEVQQQLTLTADLYDYLEEDMVEIPYTYDDSWDIYAGGSRVYLNQDAEEIASWKKIGVQSIYYGGDECNKSNIVWYETSTGIASVLQSEKNAAVIYNLAGQRVQNAQKGLYIVNGKKVMVK